MKLNKKQLDILYSEKFWLSKYSELLGIENNKADKTKYLLNENSIEKINKFYQNKTYVDANFDVQATTLLYSRAASKIKPKEVGQIPSAPIPLIIYTSTATAVGSGIIQGEAFLNLYSSGQAIGSGTISGDSILEFYTSGSAIGSGTLYGSGTFSGSIFVDFYTSGSAIGSGTAQGAFSYINYYTSGPVYGSGTISGDYSYIDYLSSGSAIGSGTVSASGTLDAPVAVYPELLSTTVTGDASGDIAIDMPATVNSGDLLVMAAMGVTNANGVGTYGTPSGWTKLSSATEANHVHTCMAVYYKVADGTEDGGSVTVTRDGSWLSEGSSGGVVMRFASGSYSSIELADESSGNPGEPITGDFTPSWGEDSPWRAQSFVATFGGTPETTPTISGGFITGSTGVVESNVRHFTCYRENEATTTIGSVQWSAFSSNPTDLSSIGVAIEGIYE